MGKERNATGTGGTVTSVDIAAGSGISVTGGPITSSGSITVTNNDRGSSQNIFKNIAVSGQSSVIADSNDDTLTLVSGSGISITTDASTDTITITNTQSPLASADTNSLTFRATTPYVVTTPFDVVIIDSNLIERSAPNTVFDFNKIMAVVTLEVENTGVNSSFVGFDLRLYNFTTSSTVSGSNIRWSAYMYPSTGEFGYTSFTYHIPIEDASVSASDIIQLQLQLATGTCSITNVSFTLMSITT
jgi:hypothetical protein